MAFSARFRLHPLVRGFAALMIASTLATSMPLTAFAQAAADATASASTSAAPTNGSTGGVPPQVVACQDPGALGYLSCAFASFTIMVIAALIGVVTTIMYYSDYLFSYAITSTIIDFNTWYSSLQDKISNIWSIFRDLANILIIGLFVFIAISIILGLQEYGQRRLIARVIIVAILINFSFLFTIIVINASNLFATQIYSAIVQTSPQSADPNAAPQGVGQQLATAMGLGSIQDTRNMLMTQYNSPSGFEGVFLHAFFLTVFAVGAIGVFLYASFLLFARFIVLILLLILSAAAFASYLSPGWAESGWSRWWNSLLRNAFFAPVFMLFLLATVNLARGLAPKGASGSGGTLGAFAASAPNSGPWDSAFVYISILGLFFGGVVISSSIAGGIARRTGQVGLGTITGAGAWAGAWFGRNTIGRRADKYISDKSAQADKLSTTIARKQAVGDMSWKTDQRQLERIMQQKARATSLAKSTFDVRNTALGGLLKRTGASAALTEGTKKNYADSAHAEAEKAAKEAVSASIGKERAKTVATETHKSEKEQLQAEHENAQTEARQARESIRNERSQAEAELQRHKAQEEQERTAHENARAQLNGASPQERNRLIQQMNEQTERIKSAQANSAQVQQRIGTLDTAAHNADAKVKQAKEKLDAVEGKIKATTEKIMSAQGEMVQDLAGRSIGGGFKRALANATGIGVDSQVVHHAREIAGKRLGLKDEAEKKAALDSYNKSHDDHAAKPAAGGGEHHA